VREPLSPADVVGTWAGLRPLVKAATSGRTADLSRRHKVLVSGSGVVTITGGKLTTYREMAEDTVEAVLERLPDAPRGARRCRTRNLRVRGADLGDLGDLGHLEDSTRGHLRDRYGSEARVVAAMVEADPSLGAPLVAGLPYLRAEALYAVRHEMARTLDDILARRTRARIQARDASAAAASAVATLVGPELGWSTDEQARQADAYVALIDAERVAPGLPETHLAPGGAPMTTDGTS